MRTAMTDEEELDEAIELMGGAATIDREMQRFSRDNQVFQRDWDHLIERYDGQWVAVFDGEIRATGKDINVVLAELERKGFPRGLAAIRFIERKQRIMIV